MLPSFVIGLREGLEAALIVGIIAAFLVTRGRGLRPMWLGVALAIALCASLAVIFTVVGSQLSFKARETVEGVLSLVAVAGVTYMIVWMRRHSRELKGQLETRAALALTAGSGLALAFMAFFAVLREGLETAIFLLAAFQQTADPLVAGLGALIGVLVAVGLGYGIYRGGIRIDMARFFKVTGVVLVFVAAGLLASAVHEFAEAGSPHRRTERRLRPVVAGLERERPGLADHRHVRTPTGAHGRRSVRLARLRGADDHLHPEARSSHGDSRYTNRVDGRLRSRPPPERSTMPNRRNTRLLVLAALVAIAAGCTSTGGEGDVAVSLRDDAVTLSPATADAGSVTFAATNDGSVTHEIEVFSGDVDPSTLPIENNVASTEGLTLIDEIEDITPGSSADLTIDLDAGTYVVMCNLAGHFEQGMYASLEVA